jgi:hypothetical protein
MSTNFYLHTPEGQEIHIGKRSIGWPFHFRGYPERGVLDYSSWIELLSQGEIRDEYGQVLTADELTDEVDRLRREARHGQYERRPDSTQRDDESGNRFTLVEFC